MHVSLALILLFIQGTDDPAHDWRGLILILDQSRKYYSYEIDDSVDLAAAAKIPVDISKAWDNKVRDRTVRICVLLEDSISWFPNQGYMYSVRHWLWCVVSCQAHSPSVIRLIVGFQQNGQ